MKKNTWLWRWAVLLAVVCVAVPLTGCEDDDSPSVNITGVWDEVYVESTGAWTCLGTINVVQSGSAVSGTYSQPSAGAAGTVSGTVSDNSVIMTYRSNTGGSPYTVTGTISGSSGSGSWSNPTTGLGGTWTATKR